MKRIIHLIIFFALACAAIACSNYDDDINRLDEASKTLETKVSELKSSLASLEKTDKELKGYIDALEKKSSDLQTAVDAIKEQLANGGSEEVLASLRSLRTEMENNLAKVNSSIDDLKKKDTELEEMITSLKTDLANDIKTWTGEKYDKTISDLAESVAAIKGTVESLQKSLGSLSDRIDKIEKDLDSIIAAKIGDVKKDITGECSKALQDAVGDLETKINGIKEYIDKALENYYTKNEIDLALVSILYVPTYTDGLIRIPYRLKNGEYVTENFEVFFDTSCEESLKDYLYIENAQAYYTVDYGDDEDEAGDIAKITVIDAEYYPGGFSLTLSAASFDDLFFAGRLGAKLGVTVSLNGRLILLGYYTLVPANLDQDVKTFWVENTPFRMVKVRAGSFDMGSPSYFSGVLDNAKPQHKVTLTKDYWIAETELTQKLYRTVMGDDNVTARWTENYGDDMPAYGLSWNESKTFIEKLNDITGEEFRFPTEAEWEFAARGGIKSEGFLYSGSQNADEVAWIASNSGGRLHSVGMKKPNELGLYDMSGNCPEWCSDWYAPYGAGAQTDPVGSGSGDGKVIRSRASMDNGDLLSISVYFRDHQSADHAYAMHSTVRLALTVE